jgi:hypothetical protein
MDMRFVAMPNSLKTRSTNNYLDSTSEVMILNALIYLVGVAFSNG